MNATTKSGKIELNSKYTVTTEELMEILGVGRKTAVEIGRAACTKVVVGKRIIWNLYSNNYFRYTPFVVNVDIKINFKILKFILKGKWEYFSWIDSFLDKLETDISEEYYFKKINWDSTYTILQSLNKQSKIIM